MTCCRKNGSILLLHSGKNFTGAFAEADFSDAFPSAPSFERHSIAVLQKDALFSHTNNKRS
jgi:hypothetical protein